MSEMVNTVAIVQARMTSTRLPGKVLMDICGKPALAHVIERLKRVPEIDAIVVATTTGHRDDAVHALARDLGVDGFRGDETDVLGRFAGAARAARADIVVRVTGDCPLLDPSVVGRVIAERANSGADYASNTLRRGYPIGMDAEAFLATALHAADQEALAEDEREHVTPFVYRHGERFHLENVAAPPDLKRPDLRLTLDTAEDLDLIRAVFDALYPQNPTFTLADVLALIDARPELAEINRNVRHRWVSA